MIKVRFREKSKRNDCWIDLNTNPGRIRHIINYNKIGNINVNNVYIGLEVDVLGLYDKWYSGKIVDIDYDKKLIQVGYKTSMIHLVEWLNHDSYRIALLDESTTIEVTEVEPRVSPCQRRGFGMCCVNNVVYLFGGFDADGALRDFWYFENNNWWEVWSQKTNKSPINRFDHTLNSYQDNILLFGGFSYDTDYNDLWIYSTDDNEWNIVESQGNSKLPTVKKHQTVIYNHYLIIYGGVFKKKRYNDYVYLYDLKKGKLLRVKGQNVPAKRYLHGMCCFKDKLIINGGFNRMNSKNKLADMHMININDLINKNNPTWIPIQDNISFPILNQTLLSFNGVSYCFGENSNMISWNPSLILHSNKLKFVLYYIESIIQTSLIPNLVVDLVLKYCINSFNKHHYICKNNSNQNIFKNYVHKGCSVTIHNKNYIFTFGYNNFKSKMHGCHTYLIEI